MRLPRKNSLFYTLMLPLVLVIFMQAVGVFLLAYGFGTISQLKLSAYSSLNEKVSLRASSFQSEITRWTNVNSRIKNIVSKTETAMLENNLSANPDEWSLIESNKVVNAVKDDVIGAINQQMVNGSFFVLTGESYVNNAIKSGLYVHCDSPGAAPNRSIYVHIASYDMFKQLKAEGYSDASSKDMVFNFDFTDKYTTKAAAYFENPIKTYLSYKEDYKNDINIYGYWSEPINIVSPNFSVVTYTLPVFVNNSLIGVYGIDINTSSIASLLPSVELPSESRDGFYVLGLNMGDNTYLPIAKNGVEYSYIFNESDNVLLNFDNENKVYNIKNSKSNVKASAGVAPLETYKNNSPFINNSWAIIGIVKTSDLLVNVSRTETATIIMVVTLVAIGFIIALISSSFVLRPIKKLTTQIASAPSSRELSLNKTNIYEFDELISAINRLTDDVATTESKMGYVLSSSNSEIGAYEVNTQDQNYYCSEKVYSLINLPQKPYGEKHTYDEFMEHLHNFENYFIEDIPNTSKKLYNFYDSHGDPKWVTVQMYFENNKMIGVVQDVTREEIEKNRLEYERDYDMLTDIFNRRAFNSRLLTLFENKDALKIGGFLFIDIDNLKTANDTYGHEVGDDCIRATAHILKASSNPTNVIAGRLSGDEFCMFAYGYDSVESVRTFFKSVHTRLKKAFVYTADNVHLSVRSTGGIAYYPMDASSLDELRNAADFAMYEAKSSKKGDFLEFNKESYFQKAYLFRGNEDLNMLLEKNLINYHFQPIISVDDGSIHGFEALLRSQLESLSSPAEIIALARAQGKLHLIEKMTWSNVLDFAKPVLNSFPKAKLFVNSIPNQMIQDSEINKIETKFPELLPRVVVEFTEDEKLAPEVTEKKRAFINKWGGAIALDDFGTGYNGETVLLILNPDYIKVDMFIIRDIDIHEEKQRLLKSIASYAASRKIKIIVEGIETREELKTVIECGANYIQGYYLARPMPSPQPLREDVIRELLQLKEQYQPKS